MKQLTAFILTFSLFAFQFSELLVYASFKLNQNYIAKNLCIEKDVEGSTCQGCCQLEKRINEQQESKKALPPVQTEKQNIDFFGQSELLGIAYFSCSEDLIQAERNENIPCVSHKIFHPPKL